MIQEEINLRDYNDKKLKLLLIKESIILILKYVISVLVVIGICLFVLNMNKQSRVRNLGGSMTITLEPDQKLEEITWKNGDLWYLTRPMTDDDIAETHTFQESSIYGIFEGTVTIIESKTE